MAQKIFESRRGQEPESSESRRDEKPATPSVSLGELYEAYQEKGRPRYGIVRDQYVRMHGEIRDSFYARHMVGVALVVERKRSRWRRKERVLKMRYPGEKVILVQPEFEQALWRARAIASEGRLLLGRNGEKILIERLHSVLVFLLGVLDSIVAPPGAAGDRASQWPGQSSQDAIESHHASADPRARIEKSLEVANKELDSLDIFLRKSAKVVALHHYLLGMPIGLVALAILAGGLAVAAGREWLHLHEVPVEPVVIALIAGGVGASVSVMMRISRGQRIDVDTQAGKIITGLGGVCRPLIGAILGLALYVLLKASLLPLTDRGNPDTELYLYAGLAFLAGFSERWAQDMLVRTMPSGPSRTDDAENASSMLAGGTSPEVASGSGRLPGP